MLQSMFIAMQIIEGDRVSHKTSNKIIISYANHDQKDHVTLHADVHFPNLQIDEKQLDFGCILE